MQGLHAPEGRLAGEPAPTAAGEPGPGPALGRLAATAIAAAILIMIGSGLLRRSWMPPSLAMPASGPPWQLPVQFPARVIVVMIWLAGLLGAGGVAAGLVAVRRGAPLPIRTLLVAALLGVAALTVLPPVGSTDVLDYAIYGHIAALGRSPYVMTPIEYRHMMHLTQGVPSAWARDPSVYGPLATLEQLAAARLGGRSLAVTAFYLKLANATVFAAVAFTADRLLRVDQAARLRAHLLWTANPLLIWSLIAAGHLDVLAAAIGLAGLLILDRPAIGRLPLRGFAAGACVGAAADIKIAYLLFGLAVAWSLRARPGQLLAAILGAATILVPSYAVVGLPAIKALAARASAATGWYGFYGLVRPLGIGLHHVVLVAACLMVPVAVLALRRLPAGDSPAIQAALALSLAWLFVWPHQYSWYSVMIICVLLLYPASRLDWLALAWLSVLTIADMPGTGFVGPKPLGRVLAGIQAQNLAYLAPLVMLGTLAAFVVLCLTGRWTTTPAADVSAGVSRRGQARAMSRRPGQSRSGQAR